MSVEIKSIREKKGLNQSDLAKKLGIDRANYHRLENRGDKLTVETIKIIANALGVHYTELLGIKLIANTEIPTLKKIIEDKEKVILNLKYRISEIEKDKINLQGYIDLLRMKL